jgi:hypothetical protein
MTADYAQAVRDGQAWAALKDGQIVGFAIIMAQPGYLLLDNAAVLPATQGRGIGARLLALAEEQARGPGLREIRLNANEAMTENLACHPRHGHAETHGPSKTDSIGCSSVSPSTDPTRGMSRYSPPTPTADTKIHRSTAWVLAITCWPTTRSLRNNRAPTRRSVVGSGRLVRSTVPNQIGRSVRLADGAGFGRISSELGGNCRY